MSNEQPFLLEVSNLNVNYGGIRALRDVNMHIIAGEIISVIGANGAGKSTLLKTLAGVKEFASGSINFNGKPMPKEANKIVKSGIALAPEGRRIFAPLTVLENLRLGAYTRSDAAEFNQTLERVYTLFPILRERISQRAGTLSGGEQQMLAVSRALMSQPRLLMLDEPSLGLAPVIVDILFETFVQLNKEGLTILLVEQNASLALELSHRAYVLETGSVKIEGLGLDLLDDARIRASYLGIAG